MNKLETAGAQEEFEYPESTFLQHCTRKIIVNFSCNLCKTGSFTKEFNNYEKGKVRQLLFPSTTECLLFSYSIGQHLIGGTQELWK